MDGRPNRRSNAAFLNFSSAEWTSLSHAVFECLDFVDLEIPVYKKRSTGITIAF